MFRAYVSKTPAWYRMADIELLEALFDAGNLTHSDFPLFLALMRASGWETTTATLGLPVWTVDTKQTQ